jgi:hypothetical protein
MAYATTNPPRLMGYPGLYTENSGTSDPKRRRPNWFYRTADVKSVVAVTGYFTNAVDLGLVVGDVVEVYDTTTPMVSLHRVTAVGLGHRHLGGPEHHLARLTGLAIARRHPLAGQWDAAAAA